MNRSHILIVAVALAACQKNPGTIQTAPVGAAVSVRSSSDVDSDDPKCQFPDTTEWTEPTVVSDLPDGVSSDHRGPYIKGVGGVIDSRAGNEAVLTIYNRKADTIRNLRTFSVNLSNPVPRGGGVPLGIVTSDNRVGILAQWGSCRGFVPEPEQDGRRTDRERGTGKCGCEHRRTVSHTANGSPSTRTLHDQEQPRARQGNLIGDDLPGKPDQMGGRCSGRKHRSALRCRRR